MSRRVTRHVSVFEARSRLACFLCLLVALTGCRFFRDASRDAVESLSIELAPSSNETGEASERTETSVETPARPPEVAPPRIVIPGNRWVLQESDHLTLVPSPGSKAVVLEVALDEHYQFLLERARTIPVPPESPAAPIDVKIEAYLKPGDDIHVRACAIRDDDTQTEWRRARFRIWLARPRILAGATASEIDASQTPEFAWTPVRGAGGYDVQIFRGATFVEENGAAPRMALSISQGTVTRARADVPLEPGEYSIRIQAVSENAQGEWSAPHSFRVVRPLPRVHEPAPHQVLTDPRPVIGWVAPGAHERRGFHIEITPIGAGARGDESDGENAPRDARASGSPELFVIDSPDEGSFQLPRDLPRGERFTVRVRELLDSPGGVVRGAWSAPVPFAIFEGSVDARSVRPLIVFDRRSPDRPVISPGGLLLAVLVTENEPNAVRRRIEIFERVLESDETAFAPLTDAELRFPGLSDVGPGAADVAWTQSPDGAPILVVCRDVCTTSGSHGAISLLGQHADRVANLSSAHFERSPRRPTAPAVLDTGSSIFFEQTGLLCELAQAAPAASDAEIWRLDASGAERELVTLGGAPALSPDARTLAFVSRDAVGQEIRVISSSMDEGSRVLVPAIDAERTIRGLAWSPDGGRLAFARRSQGSYGLVLADAASGEETTLTSSAADDIDPVFLPARLEPGRSNELIFTSDRDGEFNALYVVEIEPGQ